MFAVGGETDYKRRKLNEFFAQTDLEWERKMNRILDHLNKADIVLMDVRGLTNDNKDKLFEYVISLTKEQQSKITILD